LSEKQSKYNNIFTIVLNVILIMFGYDKKSIYKISVFNIKSNRTECDSRMQSSKSSMPSNGQNLSLNLIKMYLIY